MKTKKFSKKNVISLVAALLIPIAFLTSAVPTYCGRAGVTDVIVEEVTDGANDALTTIADEFINDLTSAFAPTFFIYRRLGQGLNGDVGAATDSKRYGDIDSQLSAIKNGHLTTANAYDKSMNEDSFIVNNIFTFAQRFGVALATASTIFFLCLCLMGRAEQIRDTPLQIFLKYIIVMFIIYFSWDIIYNVLEVIGKLWSNFIVKGWDGSNTLQYQHFGQVDNLFIKHFSWFGGDVTPPGRYIKWVNLGIQCFGWFLKLKLIKNFFRLFIEMAERYFVMTIMMFLFPAIAPSIISNSTSNIIHSYLRMFISQVFLLLINSIFMKIFTVCIMSGVFTDEILGYVCGLAYSKLVTKLDAYMAAMGLNVAQTGGGVADSFAGSLMTVTNALRAKDSLQRSLQNKGAQIMAKGVEKQNAGTFTVGRTIATMGGASVPKSPNMFKDEVANMITQGGTTKPIHKGSEYTMDGTIASVQEAKAVMGFSDQAMRNAEAVVGGFKDRNITIRQIDGSNDFSYTPGHVRTLEEDGKILCTVNGEDVYTPLMAHGDNFLSESDWQSITGTSDSMKIESERIDDYTQKYTIGEGTEDASSYTVYDYAAHPESVYSSGAEIVTDDKYGHSFVVVKNKPSSATAPVISEEVPEA